MPSKGIFSSFSCCTSLPKDSGNTTPNGKVKTTTNGGCCSAENIQEFKEDVGDALENTHAVIIKLANNVDKAAKKLDAAIPVLIRLLEASQVIFAADKDLQPQLASAIQYLKVVQATTKVIREIKPKADAIATKPIPTTPEEVTAVVAEANGALRAVDDYAQSLKALQGGDPKLDVALKTVVDTINKAEERATPFVLLAKIALDPTVDVTSSVSNAPSAPALTLSLA